MKKIMYFVSFAVMTLLSVSCSSDELNNVAPPTNERVANHAIMQLHSNKPSFDAEGTTRTVANNWEDEATIYLQLFTGSNRVNGVATYNQSDNSWAIQYYGSLSVTNDGKCEVYYFENDSGNDYKEVKLNQVSAIYFDKSASYSFEDNVIKVTANLKPMTGRIRFKGESANQSFIVEGIRFYDSYSIENNAFVLGNDYFKASTKKDSYSDYFYCFFDDEGKKDIEFHDRENNVSFKKTLGKNALAVGASGFLNIPTLTSRNGWAVDRYKDYTISKVTFRMIKVYKGVSGIVDDIFYISETEVTQALWKAIMNDNPSVVQGDNLPVTNISRSDCNTFMTKLKAKTGDNYRFPNSDEWCFSAIGGNLNQGNTSNDLNPLEAWLPQNSDNMPHEVKTKKPNELGIYDMCGNVWEHILYNGGNYNYKAGSSFSTTDPNWIVSYWWSDNTAQNDLGLRLISD